MYIDSSRFWCCANWATLLNESKLCYIYNMPKKHDEKYMLNYSVCMECNGRENGVSAFRWWCAKRQRAHHLCVPGLGKSRWNMCLGGREGGWMMRGASYYPVYVSFIMHEALQTNIKCFALYEEGFLMPRQRCRYIEKQNIYKPQFSAIVAQSLK